MLFVSATFMFMLMQDARALPRTAEPAPRSTSWQIDFRYLEPRRIEVQTPGHDQPEVFWYLVYTANNTSSTTQDFFPIFQLVTDESQVFETDMGVPHIVFDAIRERHHQTHPDLVDPTHAIGPLSTGADNARESVAIWRDVNLGPANRFRIYVTGLSGETRIIRNPAWNAAAKPATTAGGNDGGKYFTLRKTLEITYILPGSEGTRGTASAERMSSRWIMR